MIVVIEGLGLGAGKSFLCLTWLIAHFCRGGTAYIVDTFELRWDNLKAYVLDKYGYILEDDQYRKVPEDKIVEIHKHTAPGTDECPVVIVLDEVQKKLNARDFAQKERRELFDWACQSRHDSNDLWFLSQSAHNIDKQVRRLATHTYRVRNSKSWGMNIIMGYYWFMNKATCGLVSRHYFLVQKLDADGKTKLGKAEWVEQDPALFKCYVSKACKGRHHRLGVVVPKRQLQRRQMKTPWFRWAVAGVVLSIGVAGCSRLFKSAPLKEVADKHAQPSLPGASPLPAIERRPEVFRSQWGSERLVTDKWIYERGRMCPDGMVEAISDGQVRIRLGDGRTLFVLSDKRFRPSSVLLDKAPEVRKSGAVVVAPDSARIEAERSSPSATNKTTPGRMPGHK